MSIIRNAGHGIVYAALTIGSVIVWAQAAVLVGLVLLLLIVVL